MKIEFDAIKNDINMRERDLSFERASEFDFSTAIVQQDDRKKYLETRYVAVGLLGYWVVGYALACAVLYRNRRWHSRHQFSQG